MSWALAVIAVILLAYAVWVRPLSAVNVSAAMFFTTAGLVAGPLLDLHLHGEAIKLLAEITLVLVLFADASRISPGALRRGKKIPLRLLGIGLPLTIAAGAVVGVLVLPGLTGVEALILAVMLACTDAALGQAVVVDERLPSGIRQGLNVESGLNDGLCVPVFLIAIGLAEADEGGLSGGHALRIVGEQLGYGLLAGVVAGALGVVALRVALRPQHRGAGWLEVLPAATAAAAAGGASALGGSIFIAAFTAGLVFAWYHRERDAQVTDLVDESGEVFNAVTFIVFGAAILAPNLSRLTWQLLLYAVLSLTVVRMVPVALAMLRTHSRAATLGLLGWFGPRGLASIVFGVILLDGTSLRGESEILLAVTFTVALSVYAHGLTAAPITDRYARWWASQPEHDAASAMPADGSAEIPSRSHRSVPPADPGSGTTGDPRR